MRFPPLNGAAMAAMAIILETTGALAAPASYCSVADEVCFQWGVPEAAARSGSGNVYFQLRAPTSYAWISVGIGSLMKGSDMFVVYQDGGGNVTLSTRQGLNHVMPTYRERKGVALLAGSGVADGRMVANVRCSDCSTLSLGGANTWMSAWKKGTPLGSTNPSAHISYHDGHDTFSVDFSKTTVSSDGNPFAGNGSLSSGTRAGSETSDSSVAVVKEGKPNGAILLAHGIIMSLVFLMGFPVGSTLMPLLGKWFVHASWQVVMLLLMWAGFGIGYVLSRRLDMFFTQAHTRLGVILCVLISVQPVLGWLHHQHFVKHQQRGAISHVHIWYGRALIALGVVNGGLGLRLAGGDGPFVIAYCVLAVVFAVLYGVSVVLGSMKTRFMRKQSQSSGEGVEPK